MSAARLARGADVALATVAAPATAFALHLGVLTLAAIKHRRSGRYPRALPALPLPTLVVVVPAHNEQAGITATLASLLALDYPAELRRVLVVADNCTDATAERAAATGADVLVRTDAVHRGKGYALGAGFREALLNPAVAAVVVVDADTLVEPNLLTSAAAALSRGERAMQADYRVRDPLQSWRTTLMEIAFSAMHTVRNEGREHLNLSVGLRGNGMVFSREALDACPYSSFGLVEDIEYAGGLAAAGIRVAYLADSTVRGDMPASSEAASTQRVRWEEGRRRLRKQAVGPLLSAAVRHRSVMMADTAIELGGPPLARVALPLVGTAVAAFGLGRYFHITRWSAAVAGVGLASLTPEPRAGTA